MRCVRPVQPLQDRLAVARHPGGANALDLKQGVAGLGTVLEEAADLAVGEDDVGRDAFLASGGPPPATGVFLFVKDSSRLPHPH